MHLDRTGRDTVTRQWTPGQDRRGTLGQDSKEHGEGQQGALGHDSKERG